MRHEPTRRNRLCAGPNNRPRKIAARAIRVIQRGVTKPRPLHARLAPGVGQLYRRHGIIPLDEVRHPLQRLDVRVAPNSQVAVGDAAALFHRRRFAKHQPRAAGCELAEMDQVPIVGAAIQCGVLTHRGNDDAVF